VTRQKDGHPDVFLRDDSGAIHGKIPNGENVVILDEDADSFKIEGAGRTGWAKKNNFENINALGESSTALPAESGGSFEAADERDAQGLKDIKEWKKQPNLKRRYSWNSIGGIEDGELPLLVQLGIVAPAGPDEQWPMTELGKFWLLANAFACFYHFIISAVLMGCFSAVAENIIDERIFVALLATCVLVTTAVNSLCCAYKFLSPAGAAAASSASSR